MALPVNSRFALLHVDDDDDNVGKKNSGGGFKTVAGKKGGPATSRGPQPKNANVQNAGEAAKKKKRRRPAKKTGAESSDDVGTAATSNENLEDEEEEDDPQDEKNLEAAIMRSKMEYEQQMILKAKEQELLSSSTENHSEASTASTNGIVPKRQKNSSSANFGSEELKVIFSDTSTTKWEKAAGKKAVPDREINRILRDAENEAKRIAMAELKEKDFKKLKPLESAIVALYRTKLEEAAKAVDELSDQNRILMEERDKTKERVKNLCKILQDAEMKDKAKLAQEREAAFKVRDECLSEINDLHIELEQSKTKTHELENEIKRLHEKALNNSK